ncbi:MAG: hypothetical protein KC656_18770 [Myxococcales bacterium]|nr:hypothetical protein [Myxococcales bacterium]
MCSRTTCPDCGKPSWVGCGAHVEGVLRDVPQDERCKCKPAPPPRNSALFGWGTSRR